MDAVLSEDQVTEFHREGYLLVPGAIEPSVCAEIVEVAAQGVNPDATVWQARIFDWNEPQKDWQIHRLLGNERLIRIAEDLLEAPARVFYGMLAMVPPHGGKGLPWHQDNQYTYVLGRALNVFVALGEVTPERGGLWIAPRSHTQGLVAAHSAGGDLGGHRETDVEPENGFPIPHMAPGDLVAFDRNTLHRSVKNESDEPRFAYACQFCAEHARNAKDGEPFGDRPLGRALLG
jgi:ectoine hydroxylase-related dioxygenase (phytanoyl-CoA dioxygenase family)